ncbi:MAG TPA: hypothetical protein VNX65_02240 [Patescibacteria group bacterium]|nr:hypothetical protein [Patescibacteria group bacterium]
MLISISTTLLALTTTVLVGAAPPLAKTANTEPLHIDKQVAQRIQLISKLEDKLPQPQEEKQPLVIVNTGEGSHQDWLSAAGIPQEFWSAVDSIVRRESGWNASAWNSSDSGAYGVCQALPASKMASAGADYMTNPITQLKWCNQYALGRYGSWETAVAFWNSHRWW